jgi:hypothetical protein
MEFKFHQKDSHHGIDGMHGIHRYVYIYISMDVALQYKIKCESKPHNFYESEPHNFQLFLPSNTKLNVNLNPTTFMNLNSTIFSFFYHEVSGIQFFFKDDGHLR